MILQAADGWTEIEEPPISNIDVDSIEGWRGGSNSSAGDMDTFSEELYRLDIRCSLKCGSDPADMSQTVITNGCGMTMNDLRYICGEINTTDGIDASRLADDVNKVGTYFRLEVRDGTADGKCPLYYFRKVYPDAYELDNVVYSSTGTDPNNRIGIKSGGVYFARSDKFYIIYEIRDEDDSFTKDNPVVNTGDLMKAILFTGPDYLDSDLGVTAIQNNETMGESSLAIDPRSTVSVQMTPEGGVSTTVNFVTPCSYGTYASVDLYP